MKYRQSTLIPLLKSIFYSLTAFLFSIVFFNLSSGDLTTISNAEWIASTFVFIGVFIGLFAVLTLGFDDGLFVLENEIKYKNKEIERASLTANYGDRFFGVIKEVTLKNQDKTIKIYLSKRQFNRLSNQLEISKSQEDGLEFSCISSVKDFFIALLNVAVYSFILLMTVYLIVISSKVGGYAVAGSGLFKTVIKIYLLFMLIIGVALLVYYAYKGFKYYNYKCAISNDGLLESYVKNGESFFVNKKDVIAVYIKASLFGRIFNCFNLTVLVKIAENKTKNVSLPFSIRFSWCQKILGSLLGEESQEKIKRPPFRVAVPMLLLGVFFITLFTIYACIYGAIFLILNVLVVATFILCYFNKKSGENGDIFIAQRASINFERVYLKVEFIKSYAQTNVRFFNFLKTKNLTVYTQDLDGTVFLGYQDQSFIESLAIKIKNQNKKVDNRN